MSNIQERIEKRREYLRKKGKAYTELSIAVLLLIPCAAITIAMIVGIAWSLPGYFTSHDFRSTDPGTWIIAIISSAVLLFFFGGLTRVLARNARQWHQEIKQLPYVPPVPVDNLPAEKVLVRGSEEPAQEQGKVLLRGTDSSADTGEQELLRSSQEQAE